jgi:hypothetical protein
MSDSARMLALINTALRTGKLKPEQLAALLEKSKNPESKYVSLFHTYEEMKNAPPVRWLINNFWQAEGTTLIAALAGHTKTMVLIAIAKSLLTGIDLFGYSGFNVVEKATQVIYLIPEIPMGPAFYRFCTLFGLDEFIKDGRLLISTLSVGRRISLAEPELLAKCKGADIILDTLPRFRPMGSNESDAVGNQVLSDQLFYLQSLGARSIGAAQHSPKSFETEKCMTLENIVRGSGDIGAMVSTVWGQRQVIGDATRNLVYVENVKARDFAPVDPFLIRLRPDIDERRVIGMAKSPGTCGSMLYEITAAKQDDGKPDKETWAKAQWKKNKNLGRGKLNELVKAEYGSGISNNVLKDLLVEWNCTFEPDKVDPQTTFDDVEGGQVQ